MTIDEILAARRPAPPPLRCHKCEIRAGAAGRSTVDTGTNIRATGQIVKKVITDRERDAACMVCEDCGSAWTSIHPEALALAGQVQRGEITHTEHPQPVDVEF